MPRYTNEEHRELAVWAANCAARVLPYFEKCFPRDTRPRNAIAACRKWARTGIFRMADVRKSSLDAHAAARKAGKDTAACFAARAAGHAAAVPHVPEHAFGPALYTLKLVSAADPEHAKARMACEFRWQEQSLPAHLRDRWHAWQSARLPSRLKAEWVNFCNGGKKPARPPRRLS